MSVELIIVFLHIKLVVVVVVLWCVAMIDPVRVLLAKFRGNCNGYAPRGQLVYAARQHEIILHVVHWKSAWQQRVKTTREAAWQLELMCGELRDVTD